LFAYSEGRPKQKWKYNIVRYIDVTHDSLLVNDDDDNTFLWNQELHTDREVKENRRDIIIKNKKGKTCTLIDVAIPVDRNVVQKEAEKKLKYKCLGIVIQRMWNLKCTIIPIITGVTETITRSLRKNLEAISGKHSIV
jgi:phage/plasmid-associated DNA primase